MEELVGIFCIFVLNYFQDYGGNLMEQQFPGGQSPGGTGGNILFFCPELFSRLRWKSDGTAVPWRNWWEYFVFLPWTIFKIMVAIWWNSSPLVDNVPMTATGGHTKPARWACFDSEKEFEDELAVSFESLLRCITSQHGHGHRDSVFLPTRNKSTQSLARR